MYRTNVSRVISCLGCARHFCEYPYWNWELLDDSTVVDQDFSLVTTKILLESKGRAERKTQGCDTPTLIHVQYGKTEFLIQGKSLAA